MLLTNEQVKGLIGALKERGYLVDMRDISYVALCRFYEDHKLAYRILSKGDGDIPFEVFDRSENVVAIEDFLKENYAEETVKEVPQQKKDEGISFDELKMGLIADMNALIAIRDQVDEETGKSILEPKEMATVVKNISDIRLRLTQHFGATQKEDTHRIVVTQKYEHICPYCHHEY